jgi:hypothetical protein
MIVRSFCVNGLLQSHMYNVFTRYTFLGMYSLVVHLIVRSVVLCIHTSYKRASLLYVPSCTRVVARGCLLVVLMIELVTMKELNELIS